MPIVEFVDYEWGCTLDEFKHAIDKAMERLPENIRANARVYIESAADEGLLPNVFLGPPPEE